MDLLTDLQLHQPPAKALDIPGPLVQRQVSKSSSCLLVQHMPRNQQGDPAASFIRSSLSPHMSTECTAKINAMVVFAGCELP